MVLHPFELTKLSNSLCGPTKGTSVLHPFELTKLSNYLGFFVCPDLVLHPFELTKLSNLKFNLRSSPSYTFAKCCQFEDVSIIHKSLSIITHFSCSKL